MSSSSPESGASLPSETSVPDCIIACETSDHAPHVEALYDRAFGPGRWAKTAERLREGNTQLEDCSLVAMTEADKVVAAVRLWPVDVGGQPGTVFVGPVAVDPDWRGSALGLSLTRQCMELAKAKGFALAILVGDARYFERIGFGVVSSSAYPLPGHVPTGRLLAVELAPGAMARLKGRLTVPRAART